MFPQEKTARALLPVLLGVLLLSSMSCTTYMKMNPPADANKTFLTNNNSCYLATAANVLAGAGYGTGTTLQARADSIYTQLINQFGTANGGWADTAVTWWLGSTNNTWTTNPYTLVTVYGNKTLTPWANTNGPRDFGSYLRGCNFVGVSISWPTATGASGGHAITGWGDNGPNNNNPLTTNPTQIRLTDSDDSDTGGITHVYAYDSYTNPNPGGPNSGNGWYISYSTPHPFIKHIVTLASVANAQGVSLIQRVVGSYKILQSAEQSATDLHYRVGTDVEILSYKTELDWGGASGLSPTITESGTPRSELAVDWNLQQARVGQNSWVTITTEFIERYWNSIHYSDVNFTYPKLAKVPKFPAIGWKLESAKLEGAEKQENVTGGYILGAFDVIDPQLPSGGQVIGQYRFSHQYSYTESPEQHRFLIQGEPGYIVTNLRFGHSYGMVETGALWRFEDWMTKMPEQRITLDEKPTEIAIDWKGRLPYPKGEIVPTWVYQQKKITMR